MRKISRILLSAAVLFFLSAAASVAVRAESETKEVQVTDQADLFSDYEERKITELANELEMSSGWDAMVVTVADALGMSGEDFADQWFDKYTRSDDGVICMIDMDNREIVIRTFGKAILYLTDARIEAILDDAYVQIRKDDYYTTCTEMLKGIENAFQRGIPDGQYTYDTDTKETVGNYREPKRLTAGEIVLAVIASLAAGGITIAGICGKYRLKWDSAYQYSFRENGNLELIRKNDTFVNQIVTHRRIPKQDSNSGGSSRARSSDSRSSAHISSGGRRSGGGSRKF